MKSVSSMIAARELVEKWPSGGEKNLYCVLLVLHIPLVVLFPLLSYYTVFISTH